MQKTIWAIRIVVRPDVKPMAVKKTRLATAVTTSGTINGRLIKAKLKVLPRNRPARVIATEASVAMMVAAMAAVTAMTNELIAACWNLGASGPVKTSIYQARERPPHLVIEVEALKE